MNIEIIREISAGFSLPMFVVSSNADLLEMNDEFREYLGYAQEEQLSSSILEVTYPEDVEVTKSNFSRVANGETSQGKHEIRFMGRDGRILPAVITTRRIEIKNPAKPVCVGIVQTAEVPLPAVPTSPDADEEPGRNLHRFSRISQYDQLTGLPNRTLFYDRIKLGIDRARRNIDGMAVIVFKVDQFKIVNRSLGHRVGEQVIKAVSDRLKGSLRASDGLSRVGAASFGLILEKPDGLQTSSKVASRILSVFKTLYTVDGHDFHLTPSIGISHYPDDGEDADSLLQGADSACIMTREKGGNDYGYYQPKMEKGAKEFLEMESRLFAALESDHFEAFYQPLVNPETSQVIGLEALARWRDPVKGLISPAEFIPVAEQTGLIIPLGRRILEIVCRQAEAWLPELPLDFRIAVNISALQIARTDLGGLVREILMETGLPPSHLEIELTESALINDHERAMRALKAIKTMGVHIALDDFGTGYSAMSYLKNFPIDRIKIDRSFIANLTEGGHETAITEVIFALGRKLGIDVVAEGVETAEQIEHLLQLGCSRAQGYYFYKPLPASDIGKSFRKWFIGE